MAVLQSIFNFFAPAAEHATQAPAIEFQSESAEYLILPLTVDQIDEVLRLNHRCFSNGEHYTRHTFNYLLGEAGGISLRATDGSGRMVGFAFALINAGGAAHVTTIGVAPENRRRGIAAGLLRRLERAAAERGATTVILEVRVKNLGAQKLYIADGYNIVQRIAKYYSDGEDGFLMMKSLTAAGSAT